MSRIFTTTLRLNLADEDDRRAFEYLRRMNKKQYRSYSKAIVAAVNDHFERQERLAVDPYLETREKEERMPFSGKSWRQWHRACELPRLRYPHLPSLYRNRQHRSRTKKNYPQLWTLPIAFNITFAPDWYDCNTNRGHFYYHKKFTVDLQNTVIPNRRIFSTRLIPNKPIFTTTGGILYDRG